MGNQRLSALDSSFLAVETPTAHMHVGWVALFAPAADGRTRSFTEIRDHIARRLAHAPRYRQKLACVPFGVLAPEWADDPAFSIDRHVYWAPGPLERLVDEVMSIPLRRDRPLWEMWICEHERQFAIVGKSHHCMVDGLAAVELVSLLLDPTARPVAGEPDAWCAAPQPARRWLLARGVRDLLGQQLEMLRWPLRAAAAPRTAARQGGEGAVRMARAAGNLLRAAPASVLNQQLSPLRRLAWAHCPLADLQTVKRAHGTTVNDVVLAVVAGAMRAYLMRRGEQPVALKAMVPVSVRGAGEHLGDRVSFVFAELPCDEPSPVARLNRVHAAMSERKRGGEDDGADLLLKAAAHTPVAVQQTLSRMIAGQRTFNLVVSNVPGPAAAMYMLGCELRAAYPVVPLADRHAVSVGVVTINGRAGFGVYADPQLLPDVHELARDVDDAIADLLAAAQPRGEVQPQPRVPA